MTSNKKKKENQSSHQRFLRAKELPFFLRFDFDLLIFIILQTIKIIS